MEQENKDKPLSEDMSLEELETFSDAQDALDNDESEQADPDPETPKGEEQTTVTPEDDPDPETPDINKQFEESGLSKQYPGGISEMISRLPETNRYLRELQDANKDYKTDNDKFRDYLLEKDKQRNQPETTPEDFQDSFDIDPDKALTDKGFVKTDSLDATNKRLENLENTAIYNRMANDISKYDDLKDVAEIYRNQGEVAQGQNVIWDRINAMANKFPGISKLPLATSLELLYDKAKVSLGGTPKEKPPVIPLSDNKKNAAKTTTPHGKGGGQPVNFATMSADKLLEYAQKQDLVD